MADIVTANIYGDSIMRGTVLEAGMRYKATIGGMLQQLAARFGIQFCNRAHFGITIEKGQQLLQKDLQHGKLCDFAVVEFGGNDCSYAWDEVAAAPEKEHKPFTDIETFTKTYIQMVTDLKGAGVTPVLMTLPPVDAEKHLDFIGNTPEKRQNILHWLGDAYMIYRFHELYSRAVMQVAEVTNSILVDVRHRFLDKHNMRQLVCDDGVHPNGEGYAIVLEAFDDFIAQHRKNPAQMVFN